jgi:lipopolysaccharide export system ATP-binding protein
VSRQYLASVEQTKVPRRDWQARLNALLAEFRLEKVATTKGIQVSGGERRRTELARALALDAKGPKFLFGRTVCWC